MTLKVIYKTAAGIAARELEKYKTGDFNEAGGAHIIAALKGEDIPQNIWIEPETFEALKNLSDMGCPIAIHASSGGFAITLTPQEFAYLGPEIINQNLPADSLIKVESEDFLQPAN